MTTWIALLRGINVGGHHKLPMQDLRELLANLDCNDVKTYIQSGNAVFNSAAQPVELLTDIRAAIEQQFGFAPGVQIYSLADYESILAANPFRAAAEDPRALHITFLKTSAKAANTAALDGLRSGAEDFQLTERAFFLYAPDGIGRSKLAAKIEASLGVPGTSRNWRSARKILELAESIAA